MFLNKIKKDSFREKRREARYPFEIDVVVFCEGEFVRRKTDNTSSSGLRLHDDLPEKFKNKKLEIIIASSTEDDQPVEMYYGFLIDDTLNQITIKQNTKEILPQFDNLDVE